MERNLLHVDGKDSEISKRDKVSDVGDWSSDVCSSDLCYLFIKLSL